MLNTEAKMIKTLFAVLLALVCGVAAGQNQFEIAADRTGFRDTLIRVAPTYTNARSLAANVGEDTSVPSGAKKVLFAATCNFYAKVGGTATVPGDVTNGSAAELNPAAWQLNSSITTIGLIAPVACVVTVTFYE